MKVGWRFEQKTFYIGSLRVKFILAPIEFAKMSLTLNAPIYYVVFLKPPHDLQTCTKNLPNMEGSVSKNNQLHTKSHDELEDKSIVS